MEIRDKYRDYILIYSDRTPDGNSVACATDFNRTQVSMRFPDSASIFTDEVWTVIKALE